MIRIGDTFNGRYEILKEIGHGGMSTVFLAMDKNMNKQWAVKEIRRSGRDANDEMYSHSLQAEANMMKALDHGALPHIQDIIDQGETFCVIMDYIEGESLDKIINEYGAQPEQQVLEWSMQICDVLSYLHSQRPPIIYRDMKPGNVMLKPDGNIKIIDFGIAREYKQDMADTTVLGTRGYAPPEQYNGRTDPRSDIYALGMTMHHMLTGLDPRAKEYEYHPVRYWNPEISDGIEAIIERCVQPAAENRYQSCADLMYDLQHPELVTKGHKRRQRRRLAAFISCLALSVVFAVTGFLCSNQATRINNNQYDKLINSNIEENILDGIKIYPDRVDGVEKLVEYYGESASFGAEENSRLNSVYSAKTIDNMLEDRANTTADIAELNYRIGALYFSYYDPGTGTLNIFRDRVNKAFQFFKANATDSRLEGLDYEHKQVSDCFYQVCLFNKEFIFESASVAEASKSDYDELIETMDQSVDAIRNADAYTRLSLYNAVFTLLNDQRPTMSQLGVDKESVLQLMDKIYNEAVSVQPHKDGAISLRNEIIDNYESYRANIENWDMIESGGDRK